jgi:hypothetical protein
MRNPVYQLILIQIVLTCFNVQFGPIRNDSDMKLIKAWLETLMMTSCRLKYVCQLCLQLCNKHSSFANYE